MTATAKIIESAEWESRIGLQAIIARLGHCCRCREIRPARMFGKSTALKSGLRSWCRFCEAELERTRRAKIKAKKNFKDEGSVDGKFWPLSKVERPE